ncbi:MAG: metallophosphoesterase family protein [Prevotella sp.]
MKKFIVLLLSALCLLGNSQNNSEWKMCVISDVHIMAPELLKADGKPFQRYLSADRKLLKESTEIMDSVTNRILSEHPKVVLITGDLTKDGERVSHQYLVDHYLSKFRQKGVKVFVIPGNHDVNNPHAMVYDGDKVTRTATVTPAEFATIYGDYGYNRALARDTASLSYVAQLTPHLRLIAIDGCKYEENDFDKNTCVTSGRIKPSTLRFIREQAADAKKAGCKVIAMMHHGVVPHFADQQVLFPEYLVDNYPAVGKMLHDSGVNVVFTGHFHSQDISRDSTVTDVETGSTVSYPHPYRVIGMNADKMTITTHTLHTLGSLTAKGEDLDQKSSKFAKLSVAKMAEKYLPKTTPDMVRNAILNVVTEAYMMHLAGDERPSKTFEEEKRQLIELISNGAPSQAQLLDGVVTSFSTDKAPSDNQAVINY